MRLNSLKAADGAKADPKRLGRGRGSGLGKTAGRGHKGQKSRSGGYHKVGFEGGQMPLQRRLPKRGFRSRKRAATAEVRLHELNKLDVDVVDLAVLKAKGIVPATTQRAKVINTGTVERKLTLKGLALTKGARDAVIKAGVTVED